MQFITDSCLIPTGPVERKIIWHAPFTKCDREKDYAAAWAKVNGREESA
jgi:hypothetical protein